MKQFFLLGRNAELSYAEILSYFDSLGVKYSVEVYVKNYLVLDFVDDIEVNIQNFGGTIKIGNILFEGNAKELKQFIDENDLVDLVKLRLEANGYQVVVAYDGQAALNVVKKENPDLIILDLMLPKLDGYKVCRMLKFDQKYKKIPIILFSAKAQDEDKAIGKEVGADAYVVKPFEPKLLLATIKELLG